MILDERTEFCDATSVVLTAGSAWQNIGDVVDRQAVTGAGAAAPGNVTVDLGAGQPIYLVIAFTTSVIGSTDATGTFALRLVSDTSDNPPHVSSATVHWTGVTYSTNTSAVAALTAGVRYVAIALPSGDYERYLGIQCQVTTRNTTAGAIDAFLTLDYNRVKHYVNAIDATT